MNEKILPLWRRILPAAVVLAVAIAALLLFTRALGTKADAEALAAAERGLRRAAVECYALEGAYPRNPEYLARHYGAEADPERFIVHYEFVASNLMPEITVLPAGRESP